MSPVANEFAIRRVEIGSQKLRVAIKRGGPRTTPLMVFNGIGANLELLEPFARALQGVEVILFDVPGVGGSTLPRHHYRFPWLARLTGTLLDALGYRGAVDAWVCHGVGHWRSSSRALAPTVAGD